MAVTPASSRGRTWSSLHCFLYWRPEHTDTFLTATLTPLMEALRTSGRIEEWFFIRYAENGPHLRIRALGADPATTEELHEHLTEAVRAAPYPIGDQVEQAYRRTAGDPEALRGHGEVRETAYEPETERYGGAAALPVAEEVFCQSSRIAAAAVACTPQHGQRLAAATDFVLATALALDLDPLDTVRWLRRGVIAWRGYSESTSLAPTTVQGSALDAAATQSAAVVRRWHDIHSSSASGTRLRDQWGACVKAARSRLEVDDAVSRERWLQVWSSQLHMQLNRMGVLPDEERSLYWFIASSLLAPGGTTDFFADHPRAVDRCYIDASNYAPSRMQWQQPRDLPRVEKQTQRKPFVGSPVALTAGESPSMPLGEAMTRRRCAQGDLGGSTNAEDLGNLLWSAHAGHAAPDTRGYQPRPYPSAGAKYVARLRLIARDVAGLSPGMYELEPATRTLLPIGAAPTADELAAASMWFRRENASAPYVDVSALPAMVGLHVELGALRERYGLRALRFAFLEAGHLAQNLALTAAATGLSLGVVGAFYDDIAHELFMLDGIDDVLAYLLPVGQLRSGVTGVVGRADR
ncbi:thiopeptide-type bacteriocin biosynthesis protein [Streptacidiphilus sp. EB103A]|uniref:thiopeptide-type bacteriocin biosynthesis protein n=1 Tax=Streptacidiphilus sp. EB103A TaxID=3156275 RepID=UPI00351274F2